MRTTMSFLVFTDIKKLIVFSAFNIKSLSKKLKTFFFYHEKCHHTCVYWSYFKISLNGYNYGGPCILTKNDNKLLNPLA